MDMSWLFSYRRLARNVNNDRLPRHFRDWGFEWAFGPCNRVRSEEYYPLGFIFVFVLTKKCLEILFGDQHLLGFWNLSTHYK